MPCRAPRHNLATFYQACNDGDLDALLLMLNFDDPVNGFHGDLNAHLSQYTPLHCAAANGHLECVEALLKARVDPHVKTRTPLGADTADALTAAQLADSLGWDEVATVLREAEAREPRGYYLQSGPLNGAKIYPSTLTACGRDPREASRVASKLAALSGPYFLEVSQQQSPVGLLFPGQGSQYVKMLSTAKDYPALKDMFESANRILEWDVLDVCSNGPGSKLDRPEFCHPALFVAGCAALEKLRSESPAAAERPGAVAGLGVGELTALVAAGVVSFEDGLRLVRARSEALAEASAAGPQQATLSVAGLRRQRLAELCQEVMETAGPDAACSIANELFPKGATCAGTKVELEKLAELAKANGALQAKLVTSCGAYHTKLMKPAVPRFAQALREVAPRMRPPKCDVYVNSLGKAVHAGSKPEALIYPLLRQLTEPVLWESCVKAMVKAGITEFREVGPMKQLKAMMKRIDPVMFERTENVEV